MMGRKRGEKEYCCERERKDPMISSQHGGQEGQAMGDQELLVDGGDDQSKLRLLQQQTCLPWVETAGSSEGRSSSLSSALAFTGQGPLLC